MNKYYGSSTWHYEVEDKTGSVELNSNTTSNFKKDESMARYLVRKKLNIKKLPKGSKVWPN